MAKIKLQWFECWMRSDGCVSFLNAAQTDWVVVNASVHGQPVITLESPARFGSRDEARKAMSTWEKLKGEKRFLKHVVRREK